MKRHLSSVLLVMVVLASLLSACAAPATPAAPAATQAPAATSAPAAMAAPAATQPPAPTTVPPTAVPAAEPVTLEVWVYDSFAKDESAPIYAAVKKFNEQNPGITVELVPTQYGSAPYRDKYITAAQAGGGPDVLMADIIWNVMFASMGLALPIDEYLGDGAKNFFPGPMETVTYQGKVYGLPFYTNALGMYYNKDAFEAAGLPEPKAGWTWDDFLTAAKALTKDDKYGFGLMAGYGGTFEWFPWLWQNGGELLTADGTKTAFNSPEGIEAAKFFLNLMTTEKVTPEAAKTWKTWDELAAAFATGTIAMYEVGDWSLATVDGKQPAFEWGVAPLPMKKTSASVVGGANWVINNSTKNPEAAYKFLEYITGPDVFSLLDGYKRLAARRGGEQEIVKNDPRMQVFVEILETARARPSVPAWTTVDYDCLQPAFLKVELEGADVETVFAEAQNCGDAALAGQ